MKSIFIVIRNIAMAIDDVPVKLDEALQSLCEGDLS